MGSRARHTPPALIFDLDGTLADTLDDITDSVNQVFSEMGLPAVPADRIRRLIGEGLTTLLQRASGIDDPAMLASLVERYRPVYATRILDRTRLYPQIDHLLDTLTGSGAKMCVLSNKPQEFTAPICAGLLSRWSFVRCFGHRNGMERKPAPDVAIQLADAMDRAVEDVFFVGDSSVDVMTAHNAGMVPVAVTWGFRDRQELAAARPAHLIDHPMELAQLLTGEP